MSDVATTTTERFRPSGPRSFSMNSRTSRPRSPIRPTTTTSAAQPRAIMPRRVDLPTPEPAKRPSRWPRPAGMKVSIARTPVGSASRIRCRRRGCGGVAAPGAVRSTGTRPRPSKGRPKASRTRPRSSGPGRGSGGRSVAATSQPTWRPAVSPRGMRRTRCSRRPTTSARTLKSVRGERTRHRSPRPTFGPSDSMIRPTMLVTAPTRCTGATCRTCMRRRSTSGATVSEAMADCTGGRFSCRSGCAREWPAWSAGGCRSGRSGCAPCSHPARGRRRCAPAARGSAAASRD